MFHVFVAIRGANNSEVNNTAADYIKLGLLLAEKALKLIGFSETPRLQLRHTGPRKMDRRIKKGVRKL